MNCPRCTQEIPEGGRFCPACGLDLHSVSGEFSALDLGLEEAKSPRDQAGADRYAAAGSGLAGAAAAGAEGAGGADSKNGPSGTAAEGGDGFWPSWLALRSVGSFKKPKLAATLAFFFGPFVYLYLEQATWFWAGFLGGILLCVIGWPYMLFLLHLGFILHSWDVARILNDRLQELNPEVFPEDLIENEGV